MLCFIIIILSLCSDIKKMPLGKLSKQQIAKGFEALEEIEEAIKKKSNEAKLAELSSKFFTIIPHNFGRIRPPVIKDDKIIQDKKDMLLVSKAMCKYNNNWHPQYHNKLNQDLYIYIHTCVQYITDTFATFIHFHSMNFHLFPVRSWLISRLPRVLKQSQNKLRRR